MDNLPQDLEGYIYKITSIDTNKYYIGQTLSYNYIKKDNTWRKSGIDMRLRLHLRDSKEFPERPLYKDIITYGIERFKIDIIHEVDIYDFNKMNYLEHEEIEKNNSKIPLGYNISDNTISNNITKELVIKKLNLVSIEPDYNPKTRKERRQQVLVTIKNRETFFVSKDIEKIALKMIKSSNEPSCIRVNVYIKDESDIYRCDFTVNKRKKININDAYLQAINYSNKLTGNKELIEISENINETYKYQDKLNLLDTEKITEISGKIYYHKQTMSNLYVLFFRGETKNKIQFGGRKNTIDQTYKEVLEFIDKLKVKHPEIKKINLDSINSCLQQQATTKVANITFVDE
jgi:hypothetical protein